MQVLLVRHAEAVEAGGSLPDVARPLTLAGARAFARSVKGLARTGVGVDLLLHSPLLRAVETADLLARLLVRGGRTRVSATLAEAPGPALLAEIEAEPGADRVALVGHQPWMGELCAWLVLGSAAEGTRFPFAKGAVARLQGEPRPGAMRLTDLWTPDVMRRLRK